MKLMTRDSDYAIRALFFMSCSAQAVVSVHDLTSALKTPRAFMRKTLQILSRAGIVRSHKGIGGGFSLARPPESITILEVMRAFQGPFKINECTFKKKSCPQKKRCALHKKLMELEAHVRAELEPLTIGGLLQEK